MRPIQARNTKVDCTNQSFDVYADDSFTGDWDQVNAESDPDTARSRTGYVILYASCPVIWASKLQSEIALSPTESEYLAISTAAREMLPLMEIVQEMRDHGCGSRTTTPRLHCWVFKTSAAPLSWLQVSLIQRCVQERATSIPSTIISGTRFKMALSPFILSQQKTCLQMSSAKSAKKRLTPNCISN
jgi:hypothetical protein